MDFFNPPVLEHYGGFLRHFLGAVVRIPKAGCQENYLLESPINLGDTPSEMV